MSRRLATVLRVAALQETLARAEAGRAGVVVHEASLVEQQRRAALAGSALPGGSPSALQQALALSALRAQAVGTAQTAVAEAEAARADALDGWTRARARARLLEELDDRLRRQEQADEIAAAQKVADDLSSGRRGEDR